MSPWWRWTAGFVTGAGAVLWVLLLPNCQADGPRRVPAGGTLTEERTVRLHFDWAIAGCRPTREELRLECGDAWDGAIVEFKPDPPRVHRWIVTTGGAVPTPTPVRSYGGGTYGRP